MSALILAGMQEVAITFEPTALDLRDSTITVASFIGDISTPEELTDAVKALQQLKGIAKQVEASRADIKAPVLTLSRQIDEKAKEFVAPLNVEIQRVDKLINEFQKRQAAAAREAERLRQVEIQRARDEEAARLRQIEAERQAAIKQAEAEAKEAASLLDEPAPAAAPVAEVARIDEAARQAAVQASEVAHAAEVAVVVATSSAVVVAKPAGMQVRKNPEFKINDLLGFAFARPDLVDITPKRALILAEMRKKEPWDGERPLVAGCSDNSPVAVGWWEEKVIV